MPPSALARRRRRIGAVLALLLLLPACRFGEAGEAASCDDVIIVAARGSGQPAGSGGVQVEAFASQLRQTLPDRAVDVIPLEYPATPIGVGGDIAGSIAAGVATLTDLLEDGVGDCPDAHVALVGYSQGALVLRQMMEEPAAAAVASAAADAVVLLADPARDGADPGVSHVGDALDAVDGLVSPRPVPATWPLPVVSVCARGDLFCAASFTDGLAALGAAQEPGSEPPDTHASAYLQPDLATAAATAAVAALGLD